MEPWGVRNRRDRPKPTVYPKKGKKGQKRPKMAIQGGQLGGKTPKIAIPRSTAHQAYPNTRWTPVSTKDHPNRPSRGQDSSFLAVFRIFRVTATLRRSKNSVKFEKSSKRPQDPQEGSIMIQICEGITPGGSETAEIGPNLLYMPKSPQAWTIPDCS